MLRRVHHIANGAHSRQSSADSVQQENALRSSVLSDAGDGESQLCIHAQAVKLHMNSVPA